MDEEELLIKRYAYDTFSTPRNLIEIDFINNERKKNFEIYSLYIFHRITLLLIFILFCLISFLILFSKETYIKTNFKLASSTTTTNNIYNENNLYQSRPNFIFILVDDLSWNSMGYMNFDLDFATPTLTELAKNGIIISNYYTQEICTPSRASLMTGKYPINIGMQYGEILPTQEWGLPLNEIIFPQILKDYSYQNYAIGKWNLGHYTSSYLPTSRGFDEYIGFLGAEEYYWSKYKIDSIFKDFIQSNTSCYNQYNQDDVNIYSTTLYQNKINQIINKHNFELNPMFLYFASQAVHAPFIDDKFNEFNQGIPESYIDKDLYTYVIEHIQGNVRQQYALSLILLDQAISNIMKALENKQQLDNTYIIFTSDNGGCAGAGGQNGPLRGSKGSLFEGGTKVNAFISSPLLKPYINKAMNQSKSNNNNSINTTGLIYNGLMHVSDWFPTILELANIDVNDWKTMKVHIDNNINNSIDYNNLQLDGVSHVQAMIYNDINLNKRKYLLYNAYINITGEDFNIEHNANIAIRNNRYKLMHGFINNQASNWYPYNTNALVTYPQVVSASIVNKNIITTQEDDDIAATDICHTYIALEGSFSYMLYDLQEDPYEMINLYNNSNYNSVKSELYDEMYKLISKAKVDYQGNEETNGTIHKYWALNGYFMQPFLLTSNELYPKLCIDMH